MSNDFTINNFSGSVPRLASHLLPPGSAERAVDCRLDTGQLSSWRELKKVQDVPPGTLSAKQLGCCWKFYPSCVDIARGAVNCTSYYATGVKEYPLHIDVPEGDCQAFECRLGIPCPPSAPKVTAVRATYSEDRGSESYVYAYQYEDAYGDRGPISPASKPINVNFEAGDSVKVEGMAPPSEEWCAIRVIILRANSGMNSGREEANAEDTVWVQVGYKDVYSGGFPPINPYNDNLSDINTFGAAIEDWVEPPPKNLKGIIWVEGSNCLAGYAGNRLYFSENNVYGNWKHYYDLDDKIRGIVESNGAVYVATDGRPYVVQAKANCEEAGSRAIIRLAGEYPMVASRNRAIAKTRFGAVYPSHDGLIMLSGNSPAAVLTWGLYTPTQWQAMEPHTAIPVEHGGKLFVFLAAGAFAMATPESSEQGWSNDSHTELSDRGVIDAFVVRTGELYILKEDGLYLWDRGNTFREHKWVSREVVTPVDFAFGACHINFNGAEEKVKITADNREVVNRNVLSSRPFTLPMWAIGSRWQIELSGTGRVNLFSIAPSMHDLGS